MAVYIPIKWYASHWDLTKLLNAFQKTWYSSILTADLFFIFENMFNNMKIIKIRVVGKLDFPYDSCLQYLNKKEYTVKLKNKQIGK